MTGSIRVGGIVCLPCWFVFHELGPGLCGAHIPVDYTYDEWECDRCGAQFAGAEEEYGGDA